VKKKKVTIDDRDAADNEIKKEIGKTIKQLRGSLGLSAQTVADHLKISREAVTHIENGRNNVSAVSLWKLATLFNCEVEDFFPVLPDGYAITKVDIRKVAQEKGEKAAAWAERLFKNKK
jgi:transcriptional regulator with XRE-family HTH domain